MITARSENAHASSCESQPRTSHLIARERLHRSAKRIVASAAPSIVRPDEVVVHHPAVTTITAEVPSNEAAPNATIGASVSSLTTKAPRTTIRPTQSAANHWAIHHSGPSAPISPDSPPAAGLMWSRSSGVPKKVVIPRPTSWRRPIFTKSSSRKAPALRARAVISAQRMATANASQTNRPRATRRAAPSQSRLEPLGPLATCSDTWLDSTAVVTPLCDPAIYLTVVELNLAQDPRWSAGSDRRQPECRS